MAYAARRGTCRVCGRTYTLTAAGHIHKHWARDGMGKALPYSDPCVGSRKLPKGQPYYQTLSEIRDQK